MFIVKKKCYFLKLILLFVLCTENIVIISVNNTYIIILHNIYEEKPRVIKYINGYVC